MIWSEILLENGIVLSKYKEKLGIESITYADVYSEHKTLLINTYGRIF